MWGAFPAESTAQGGRGASCSPEERSKETETGGGGQRWRVSAEGGKGLRKGLFHSPGERQQHLGPGLVGAGEKQL